MLFRLFQARHPVQQEGIIDENDNINSVPPSGMHFQTMVYEPAILRVEPSGEDLKLMSTAAGGILGVREKGEKRGVFYWRQIH